MAKPKRELQELMAKDEAVFEQFTMSLEERYSDDELAYMLAKTLTQLKRWDEQQAMLLQLGHDEDAVQRAFEHTVQRGRIVAELQAWRALGEQMGVHPDQDGCNGSVN